MNEQADKDRLSALYEIRRLIEESLVLADKASMPMATYLLEMALAEAEDEMERAKSPKQ